MGSARLQVLPPSSDSEHIREKCSRQRVIPLMVRGFLSLDVLANRLFILARCGHVVASCPEALPDEVPPPSPDAPRDVDGTLPLYESNHLGHHTLGRNRHKHVYMVRQQMPFLNTAFLLTSQFVEHLPKFPPQLAMQNLPLWTGGLSRGPAA